MSLILARHALQKLSLLCAICIRLTSFSIHLYVVDGELIQF